MTWGDFKAYLEKNGIKDDDEIWYIDISFPEEKDLTIGRDDDHGFCV